MCETPIARAYASAKLETIYGGTNEIMKELIARSIVKETLLNTWSKIYSCVRLFDSEDAQHGRYA